MLTLGVVLVIGQVAVILLLWRFVQTLKNYTAALVKAHNSNIIIHERQEAITAHLRRLSGEGARP